ncbi:hypothetical protein [Clostridium puniceum]|nr:hypothetical protein [Clostridium puniceum]
MSCRESMVGENRYFSFRVITPEQNPERESNFLSKRCPVCIRYMQGFVRT